MRHSLEVRVPFLDARLVEYVLSLPESAKRDRTPRPKPFWLMRLGNFCPRKCVGQRKRTFTFPWENWLRGALGKRVAAGLAGLVACYWSRMIGRRFRAAVWQEFLGGRTTWSRPWSLYVLNEWVKRNVHRISRAALCDRGGARCSGYHQVETAYPTGTRSARIVL